MKKNRLIFATSSLIIGLVLVVFLAMASSVLARETKTVPTRQASKVSLQKEAVSQPRFVEVSSNARAGLDVFCSTANLAIPDNDPTGATDDLVINANGQINDIDISLDATHTWVGDVTFSVEHVDTGSTAVIFDQPGVPATTFGCSGDNIDASINDEAATDVENECDAGIPTIQGDFIGGDPPSTSLLAVFDGEDMAGTWRITASDGAAGDTGTLNEWCVIADADPAGYSIQLTKTVSTDPTGCATTDTITLPYGGGDVTYCYNVTNVGLVTLTNHTLTDTELGVLLDNFAYDLAPGASVYITQGATITTTTVNIATWEATDGMTSTTRSAVATVNVEPPDPMIDVDPDSIASTQPADTLITQTLTVSNIGTGDLDWTITESLTLVLPQTPKVTDGTKTQAQPVAPSVVTDATQCGLYDSYAGSEPVGYAQYCLGLDAQPTNQAANSFDPTDTGFAHDIRNTGNFVSFTLNDFPGQTAVGTNANIYWGMDFNADATTLYAIEDMGNSASPDTIGTIDTTTGAYTSISTINNPNAGIFTGLAIDTNGTFYLSDATQLFTVDPGTGTVTLVGNFNAGGIMIDIDISPTGQMYGHDISDDAIYTIDKSTGAATVVGTTGLAGNFAQGMTFDNIDGTLYIFLYTGGGTNTYGTVNLATGAVTPLAQDNPLGEFEGATMTGSAGPTCGGDIPWVSVSPDSGSTAGGDSDEVGVIFDSTGLSIGVYTGTLCINSNDDDTPLVTVPLTLTVVDPTYAIALGPDSAVSGMPGTTVTHTMWVTNNSNVAGVVSLSVAGNSWNASFSDNNFVLNNGASTMIEAYVEIPAAAAGGSMDVATVTATIGDASASASATTTAENVYGVAVAEDMTGTGNIGGSVMYHIWVTNTGNITDTFALSVSGNSWTTTAAGPLTLAAGEGAMVMVTVAIPGSASSGDVDVATVTATSQTDASASGSVTLTTTAEGSFLYLPFVTKN